MQTRLFFFSKIKNKISAGRGIDTGSKNEPCFDFLL